MMERNHLERALNDCVPALAALPVVGIGAYARVEAALDVLIALDRIYRNPNDEPYTPLTAALQRIKATAESATALAAHLTPFDAEDSGADHEPVAQLFAKAWTTYSDSTYDHSVGLVVERLKRSGFDDAYFQGKTCFDGGCGTGRLSIAMAKAGARRVVAVDVSEQSLEYLRRTMARYRLSNIEIVRQDVTDLSRFDTASFDFVASNGVLHHTPAPERGIVEHFRVTKPGGTFWLYLYGAGGIYWHVYDQFRPIVTALSLEENHRILRELRMREGLIYTFLDNLRAPRVYFLLDEVLAMLRPHGDFGHRHARGMSVIDDTEMLLATKWGPTILGPQGEIRIVVSKQ
jgi:ubiquinone/menaquinone biosynthesis C-methylase UbiE